MERDFTNNWDDPANPYGQYYQPPPVQPATPKPGQGGTGYGAQNTQTSGFGDPAAGYGPGGVDNPAFQHNWTMDDVTRLAGEEAKPPTFPTPPPPPAPTEPGPPNPQPGGDGRVAPLPATGGGGIPPATLPSSVQAQFNQQPQQTPVQSAYQTALLDFMKRSQETPSLNDATLGPQAEVFRVQQQRNQEKNRRFAAERAASSGQSRSGYLDNLIGEGVQQQNFNTAQFNAGLLGGEMDKRRQELIAALQLASATGNNEAARELQARLAQVSAMMQQQGLNLQGQLGFGDLSLRALMGEMGNNQFYDALGVSTALGMEGLNQRAVEVLLRGGQ